MEIKRRKFQSVLNILSFNRHFYIIGILVWASILITLILLKTPLLWIFSISLAFIYGLLMPLIISAYVYDFSGYYDFNWLQQFGLSREKTLNLININAGFDETSYILKNNFKASELQVFDFYNPVRHTEPAIVRARKISMTYPNTTEIQSNYIPVKDNTVDIIFLLSAAHEIRSHTERIVFLKECKRICKPNGRVITVEHLRDLPNFLAFSFGFTHFFSETTWRNAFQEAGFATFEETKFTPFMSIFNCQAS
ncbi:class I SAM-dependent methyltransferase [Robertkochia solimangrovi]|uniref:class I SAM-dependent methyltransferase n=1 Tax=Robertkochia solimangrovi TaxID=2213046 RepID=UPI00117C20E1|nr:methyltransferase domain-containing protein [Robertkochia solimangrovi]TRZ45095.1 methyltransferase type 11 [Robertkochia solimangrovi]